MFFNTPLKEYLKKISYVPQKGSVDWDFPTNVLDVVLMGRYGKLGWFKRPTEEDVRIAKKQSKSWYGRFYGSTNQ